MGNLLAKKEYAINLYKCKYFEKDIDLSYKICKELFDNRYYFYDDFFEEYGVYTREEDNLDWIFEHAKKSADFINGPKACYCVFYLNQKPKKLNEKEEIVYLLRSYNNKHIIATLVLAKYYYYGDSKVGIHKNENKAFELFNEIVDKIDEAKYYLGVCYYYGQGTKVNYKKAKSLFSEVYKNDSRAGVYLGFCYQYGKGVKSDYEKALTYYEKASKDCAFGKVALARAYCYGMGDYLKPDYNKSINLNIEAIKESEITSAYFDLGYCYKKLKDYKNAEKIIKKLLK